MLSASQSFALIAVMALMTALLRFLPFLVFRKHTPQPILYLGKVLPFSIMAMLVVYCLKSVSLIRSPHGLPEFLAVLFVVVVHKWKHNSLLSIGLGTVCYMVLVQMVFA